jgi:hypothetical protein
MVRGHEPRKCIGLRTPGSADIFDHLGGGNRRLVGMVAGKSKYGDGIRADCAPVKASLGRIARTIAVQFNNEL